VYSNRYIYLRLLIYFIIIYPAFGMDFFLPSSVSSRQILFGSLSVFLSVLWHHMYVRQRRYVCRRSPRWDKFRRNWSTSKFKFKGERDKHVRCN